MAILLGLFNSMVAFVCLDAACHLAEEVPQPAVMIPRILYITMGTQFLVGVFYILVIGFAIKDMKVIINTSTGYSTCVVQLQKVRVLTPISQGTNHRANPTGSW